MPKAVKASKAAKKAAKGASAAAKVRTTSAAKPATTPIKKKAAVKKTAAKKAAPAKVAAKAAAPTKVAAKKAAPAKVATKKAAPAKVAAKKAAPPVKKAAPAAKAPPKAAAPAAPVKKVAPKKVVLDKFVLEQRDLLDEERRSHTAQAEALRAEADALAQEMEPGDAEFGEEGGEGGTLSIDRERDLMLSAQARQAVEEIDAALAKIPLGTYGLCEICGKPIPKPRLRAIPYARHCVDCKQGGLSRR